MEPDTKCLPTPSSETAMWSWRAPSGPGRPTSLECPGSGCGWNSPGVQTPEMVRQGAPRIPLGPEGRRPSRDLRGLVRRPVPPLCPPSGVGKQDRRPVDDLPRRETDGLGLMVIADGGEGETMGSVPLPEHERPPLHPGRSGRRARRRTSGIPGNYRSGTCRRECGFRQMGVGGITSWGPTALPKYSLPYEDYNYRFILRPIIGLECSTGNSPDTLPNPPSGGYRERNRQHQEDPMTKRAEVDPDQPRQVARARTEMRG